MKVSFFIDRPVFSAVISIVIVIVGIIGLTMLPVDQYPQITPPVVRSVRLIRVRVRLPCHRRWLLRLNRKSMVRPVCFIWNQTVLTPVASRQQLPLMYLPTRIWLLWKFRTV